MQASKGDKGGDDAGGDDDDESTPAPEQVGAFVAAALETLAARSRPRANQLQSGAACVHCSSGSLRSSVLLALCILIEQVPFLALLPSHGRKPAILAFDIAEFSSASCRRFFSYLLLFVLAPVRTNERNFVRLVFQARTEGYVDVFSVVRKLRSQRALMVHHRSQYAFLYDALAHYLRTHPASLPSTP